MGLQVWLPLNGNLNNQGLNRVSFTVSKGTPTIESGKIGNCYTFTNGTQIKSATTISTSNYKNISICAWVKNTYSDSSWSRIGGLNSHTFCHLDIRAADKAVRFFLSKDGTSNAYDYVMSTTFLTDNKWHHVCGVADENKLYIYIDGVLENTANRTSSYIADSANVWVGSLNNGRDLQGSLNDFRVYDEALSLKQIKEISKALVCHYKLEGVGANPNLLVNAYTPTAWTYESCTKVSDTNPYVIGFTTSAANQRIYLSVSNVWVSGQKYVYSFDAKASVADAAIDASRSIADFGPTHYLTTVWKHYSGIINSTLTADAGTLSIRGKTSGVTYYIKNVKLEKGEIETGWIPNIADALYTSLGYDKMLLTDVSGNGYNASLIGSLNCNLNAPRYQSSTKFDGSANYLAIGRPMPRDALTVNVWAYMDNWANYNSRIASCTEGGGWNFEPTSGGMNFALGVGASSNAYMNNFTSAQAPLSGISAGWHMFTGTFDGIYKKLYIDGVLKGSTNGCQNGTTLTTATPIFYNANNGVFIGAEAQGSQTTATSPYFNGSISDFRIYATALSAEDILALYQVSLALSKANNMYAYEFITDANNLVSLANVAIVQNKMGSYGVNRFEQTNCKVTLEDGCYKIYRTPEINSSAHNMWGGVLLKANYNGNTLIKGHSYIMLYDVKGQTTNAQDTCGWDNNMGWGGGGLTPTPTNVSYRKIPANFNSDKFETFWYKWDLTDDVYKVCTKSYSSFVEGETYLSYRDFQIGWGYESTGELGTNIYIRNFRLYDITDINNPKFLKTGITMSDEINELDDYVKIRKIGYDANSFIEI